MTAREIRDEQIRRDHPNLWYAVHHGTLPEVTDDFILAAKNYPLQRDNRAAAIAAE